MLAPSLVRRASEAPRATRACPSASRRGRGRTRLAHRRRARARGSRSPRRRSTASRRRGRAPRRSGRYARRAVRARRSVNEMARFQRFSRVRTCGSLAQDGEERPASSTARPVSPSSEARSRTAARPVRGDRGEHAVVVGKGDELGLDAPDAPRSGRARGPARRAAGRCRSDGAPAGSASSRSSSFWSTSSTRKSRCVCTSSEASSRLELADAVDGCDDEVE